MIRGLNKITKSAGLGYMMSSYTAHPDGYKAAEKEAQQIAADLLLAGLVVFAPIAYAPAIERRMIDGMLISEASSIQTHEFWMPIDERFFLRCDYGLLAITPGWDQSTGIAIEFYTLCRAGKPVWFYDPDEDRIMTITEAMEEHREGWDALIARAAEVRSAHLNVDGEAQSSTVGRLLWKAEGMTRSELEAAVGNG